MTQEERNDLVMENLALVDWVVCRKFGIMRDNQYYDDLVQEGRIELMRAAELYDESQGVKFGTYAVIHVWLALKNKRYKVLNPMSPPRFHAIALQKALPLLEKGFTDKEIIEITGMSEQLYLDAVVNAGALSLDAEMHTGDGSEFSCLGDFIVDKDTINMYDNILEREHVKRVVDKVVAKYNGWKVDFIREYFDDIMDGNEKSLQTYADKYGYTRQLIHQFLESVKTLFKRYYNSKIY